MIHEYIELVLENEAWVVLAWAVASFVVLALVVKGYRAGGRR